MMLVSNYSSNVTLHSLVCYLSVVLAKLQLIKLEDLQTVVGK